MQSCHAKFFRVLFTGLERQYPENIHLHLDYVKNQRFFHRQGTSLSKKSELIFQYESIQER